MMSLTISSFKHALCISLRLYGISCHTCDNEYTSFLEMTMLENQLNGKLFLKKKILKLFDLFHATLEVYFLLQRERTKQRYHFIECNVLQ